MTADVDCLRDGVAGRGSASAADMPRLIRELRIRAGLTQEKFAARLGVTFPTINRWENGHAKPSPLALKQIVQLAQDLAHLSSSSPQDASLTSHEIVHAPSHSADSSRG